MHVFTMSMVSCNTLKVNEKRYLLTCENYLNIFNDIQQMS